MLDHIIAYIEFLKSNYHLSISIHSNGGYLSEYMHKLAPYNIHTNPYCLYLKLNRPIWDRCIQRQGALFSQCGDELFFCTCYAGVSEYVMPIRCHDTVVGCISVSGYRTTPALPPETCDMLAEEYCLDACALSNLFACHVTKPPSAEFISTVIMPLRCMFETLCQQDNVLLQSYRSDTTNYIYGHILQYLTYNFASKIKLADIARACHCSVSYISHIFKKRSGMTINAYINQVRLKEAKRLLAQTSLPICEIAFSVGFSSSNYFTNLFTQSHHISPREYRNRCEIDS